MSTLFESAHYGIEARDEALRVAGERIEADAGKVLELVADNLDATDSPVMSNEWTAGLMLALRESKPVLALLCAGKTLEQAMVSAAGSDHFRHLMRCADVADSWIAKLIDEAAADEVDAADDVEGEA